MDEHDTLDGTRDIYISDLLNAYIPKLSDPESSSADEVRRVIKGSLSNFEKRLKLYLTNAPKDDEDSLQRYMKVVDIQENYLMQVFKNRQHHRYGPGGPNIFIHQDVLIKTMPLVLEDVNLDGTTIMDKLIQEKVMTDDERNSIIQESTPRRRKEAFIGLMRGKLSLKSLRENFIPAIEIDHPEVANKIRKISDEILENPQSSSPCAVCSTKDAVPVQSLAQPLLKADVITTGFYEELRSRNDTNSEKWAKLCERVSDHSSIIEALETPFPHFYNSFIQNDVTDMNCFCEKMLEEDSSLISNTNTYFDAGNCLLGDLDSVVSGDTTNAMAKGDRPNGQYQSSRTQTAQLILNLDPSGPDYNILIKPARPFPMQQTAPIGPATYLPQNKGYGPPTNVQPMPWLYVPPPPLPQHKYPPPPIRLDRPIRLGRPLKRMPPGAKYPKTTMIHAEPQSPIKEEEPLTASVLAAVPPKEQKQMLGERLFPIIESMNSDHASKITGMLLELDNSELLHLLETSEALKAKVDEALTVLRYHQAKEKGGRQEDS